MSDRPTDRPPGQGTGRPEAYDLLAPYALDAVDDLERRAVERLVTDDAAAASDLAALQATAAALGAGGPAAPPLPSGVRGSVLAALDGVPQETAPAATRSASRRSARRSRPRRALRAIAVAAAILAVAVPSGVAWQQHQRAERAAVVADLLAEPGVTVLQGAVEGGGEATALLGSDRAVLVVAGLAELPTGTTYQLWAMRDGVPVPAGLFETRSGPVSASQYRQGDGLAVSVEPAGGSQAPTTTPVVVLLPG